MRTGLSGLRCAAAVAAVLSAVIAGQAPAPAPAAAASCFRTVGISQQRSAGEGTGRVTFAVFTDGCTSAAEVGYELVGGTAQPGADFRPQTGRLRWAEGETRALTITAFLAADSEREAEIEEFTVRLIEPGPGVRIGQAAGQARILDDDWAVPLWAADDENCPELTPNIMCKCPEPDEPMPGDGDCVLLEFPLSAPLPSAAVIRWYTLDGTATAGVDYVAVTAGTTTVAAGTLSARVAVYLLPDPKGAPGRWFSVRIASVSTGAVADGESVVALGAA